MVCPIANQPAPGPYRGGGAGNLKLCVHAQQLLTICVRAQGFNVGGTSARRRRRGRRSPASACSSTLDRRLKLHDHHQRSPSHSRGTEPALQAPPRSPELARRLTVTLMKKLLAVCCFFGPSGGSSFGILPRRSRRRGFACPTSRTSDSSTIRPGRPTDGPYAPSPSTRCVRGCWQKALLFRRYPPPSHRSTSRSAGAACPIRGALPCLGQPVGRWYDFYSDANCPVPLSDLAIHSANVHCLPANDEIFDTLSRCAKTRWSASRAISWKPAKTVAHPGGVPWSEATPATARARSFGLPKPTNFPP